DARARSVLGVVLGIQRGHHRSKRYTWPLYQDAMMARLGCPTELLIVPLRKGTARWVRSVLRRIEGERRPMPARAVFSAVWYAGQADAERAALVAFAAWRACMELERGLGELNFSDDQPGADRRRCPEAGGTHGCERAGEARIL